jgi:hypothetical protein
LLKSRVVPAVFQREADRKPGYNVSQKTISNTVVLYQYYLDGANRPVQEQATIKSHETGIDVSPAELDEFRNFHTFISSHVEPTNMCDTPCMLLWAFPHVILEKEFRDLVVNQFGFTVFEDEARGRVYPGVRFMWRKSISQNSVDRESAMV